MQENKKQLQRYGALLDWQAGIATFAGYGNLDRQVPNEDSAVPGSKCERSMKLGIKAECLILDNGDIIWASECAMFAVEKQIAERLAEASQVKKGSIKEFRAHRRRAVAESRAKQLSAHEGAPPSPPAEKDATARMKRHGELRSKKLAELLGQDGAAKAHLVGVPE